MAQEAKKQQRSCIGCGEHGAKSALYRVVRNSEGSVLFDPTGRAAGRGAYVCSEECFRRVRKARKLNRALRVQLTDQDYERIAGELACVIDATDQE